MASEQLEEPKSILHNKDVSQLLALANLELKQSKTSIMKVNISEAIGKCAKIQIHSLDNVSKNINEIPFAQYGLLIRAIVIGIYKQYCQISSDLKETTDSLTKVRTTHLSSLIGPQKNQRRWRWRHNPQEKSHSRVKNSPSP
jgi:hypothetical protein